MPTNFRIDEFAKVADGSLGARDRVRFTSVGFDIGVGSAVPPVVGLIFVSDEAATIVTAADEIALTGSGG